MRISDWSSDVCSSDLLVAQRFSLTNKESAFDDRTRKERSWKDLPAAPSRVECGRSGYAIVRSAIGTAGRKKTMGKAVQRLYHGTSLVQYENLRRGGFVVRDLYVGDSRENITDHYALDRATIEDSYAVRSEENTSELQSIMGT